MSVDVVGALEMTVAIIDQDRLRRMGRYRGDSNLTPEHMDWALEQVRSWDLDDPSTLEKANRWLGWTQGVAEATGVSGDVLRALNQSLAVPPTPKETTLIFVDIETTTMAIAFTPERRHRTVPAWVAVPVLAVAAGLAAAVAWDAVVDLAALAARILESTPWP